MAKVVSKARQLRLNLSAKLGRPVTIEEVAEATGIARPALNRIELNQTERIDFDTITKLCTFYGVGVGELLELRTEDRIIPALAAA
jgi:putative transcriptional regulator